MHLCPAGQAYWSGDTTCRCCRWDCHRRQGTLYYRLSAKLVFYRACWLLFCKMPVASGVNCSCSLATNAAAFYSSCRFVCKQVPEPWQGGKARAAAREELPEPEAAKKPQATARPSSTSALLQRRSENAVAVRSPPTPPAADTDTDKEDKYNPRAAAEYVGDIFDYYRRVEPQYRVSPNYMSRQVRFLMQL